MQYIVLLLADRPVSGSLDLAIVKEMPLPLVATTTGAMLLCAIRDWQGNKAFERHFKHPCFASIIPLEMMGQCII